MCCVKYWRLLFGDIEELPSTIHNAELGGVINPCTVEPGLWQIRINEILAKIALLTFCDWPSATQILSEIRYIYFKF